MGWSLACGGRPTHRLAEAGAGLASSLTTPLAPWVDQLVADHRRLPLAAQLNAVVGDLNLGDPDRPGVTLPALLLPEGGCAGSWWWRPASS